MVLIIYNNWYIFTPGLATIMFILSDEDLEEIKKKRAAYLRTLEDLQREAEAEKLRRQQQTVQTIVPPLPKIVSPQKMSYSVSIQIYYQ